MLTAAALREVAEAGVGLIGLRASDRVGIVTPLFHLYALREVDAALRAGACLVVARNLTFPASVLRQLHEERVSYVAGVPAGFALFVERYGEMLARCRGHLRAVALGTAPCPPALAAALRSLLPDTRVVLTYGLTEASRVAFATRKTRTRGRDRSAAPIPAWSSVPSTIGGGRCPRTRGAGSRCARPWPPPATGTVPRPRGTCGSRTASS